MEQFQSDPSGVCKTEGKQKNRDAARWLADCMSEQVYTFIHESGITLWSEKHGLSPYQGTY